jgi:sugar lactone lactonase YvrE
MTSLLRMNLLCLFLLHLSLVSFAQSGIISTITGTGYAGFGGDGSLASSAQLNYPVGVAADSAGNLFIGDTNNNRIRKVSSAGIITTFAGTGNAGFSGDGGQASSADLNAPNNVAIDSTGNLFFYDSKNYRIRKISSTGVITTVAGNGSAGYSGDGGQAVNAQIQGGPLTVDSAGNIYISERYNNRIRKVSFAGIITTFAGNGTAAFSGDGGQATSASINNPGGVTVDAAGNLYIADWGNSRLRKASSTGVITTVAGNGNASYSGDGGQATSASLNPLGIALDYAGNLFISEFNGNRIRKVSANGTITTVAGNGTSGFSGDGGMATSAQLNNPIGVAVDSVGNLFIADSNNNRIRKVTAVNSSDIFFPHVAIGSGWSTSFTLSNTNANTVTGNLILTDYQGNPLTVNSSTLGIGSSFSFSIPAGGVMFLTANPVSPNDAAKSGWAKVTTYGGALNGVATFQSATQGIIQTSAGVLSSQLMQFATIPVDENDGQSKKTAYGIANPTTQTLAVKVALVDSNGIVLDDLVGFTLNPGQQIARYFNQDYATRPTFQGSIVLRAQGGGAFVAVALIQSQQLFSAIPVIPNKAANISN